MSIEAMKQALDALEFAKAHGEFEQGSGVLHEINNSSTTLRQAIAEAEKQEPVAWIEHEWSGTGLRHLHFERREASLRDEVVNPIWTPFYTHPQPKREPLTDVDYANACLSYRHDFGLMTQEQRDKLMFQAKEWARAFGIKGEA